jgi:hypothetical protein
MHQAGKMNLRFNILLFVCFLFSQKTEAQKNQQIIHCDSATFKNLVMTYDWMRLPEGYQLVPFDTIIGVGKFKTNTRIESNGKVIAYGSLDKNGLPTNWWGILSNIPNAALAQKFCCAGFMKKGKKESEWWAMDGYTIVYSKKKKARIKHDSFTGN